MILILFIFCAKNYCFKKGFIIDSFKTTNLFSSDRKHYTKLLIRF